MKILITGGNGFLGHHVVEHILKSTNWTIDIVDKLSYASMGFDRLKDIQAYDDKRVRNFSTDLTKPIDAYLLEELRYCDYIVHLAAETHVDNSIDHPVEFVKNNINSTLMMLEFARQCKNLKKFIYFSTDEVFGPADRKEKPNGYAEWDRYNSTNPYSASKAGGEELALAWANTYGVPVVITHTMNIFGERQHPEKFIPKCINAILDGGEIYIHADPTKTFAGSRYWIHARNVAQAIHFILDNGVIRDKYNIVGEIEVDNLRLAKEISFILGKKLNYELVDFHSSRPGHDLRYGLDGSKIANMGFEYPYSFFDSLKKSVLWSVENPKWLGR